MKKIRSITFMAAITIIISAAMYGVAAREEMTEKRKAQALKEDREIAALYSELAPEIRYRALREVRP